jgi:molecular chaperone DnaK
MQTTTHAVGIDLGTTYSCISYLNEHGKPVTLTNQEGELATPSVVLFDNDEVIVGTEALRNAISRPDKVVQNSKRFIGDESKTWTINNRTYTPVDIAGFILKKLVDSAQERIGKLEQAVITVPAQFGDAQRRATIEAGHRAGLKRVDIINEPVAAALCYVLGNEGLWFSELAEEQRIMVYDLGGGTFDLSLVKYHSDEVSVIASTGDLQLGGIDWTEVLETHAAKKFNSEFNADPRSDPQSLQYLSLEAEQAKRSLSVRSRTTITCQHAGHRKSYDIDQDTFEQLARPLVDRTASITTRMLKDHNMGWAHVDVVLITGGSSRMPMIRTQLKAMSGTTPNMELSPDQSIAHGATYYAGMLLTNDKFARSILNEQAAERLSTIQQRSVTARALGILVRKHGTRERTPNYLIKANSPLPVQETRNFGTVVDNQRRVHLQIVESGPTKTDTPTKIGDCTISDLPEDLPEGSKIAVTISYDEQARVHVSAREKASGQAASIEIVRRQILVSPEEYAQQRGSVAKTTTRRIKSKDSASTAAQNRPIPEIGFVAPDSTPTLEDATAPVPLCNDCAEPLDARGRCVPCVSKKSKQAQAVVGNKGTRKRKKKSRKPPEPVEPIPLIDEDDLWDPDGDDFWNMIDA